MKNHKNNADLKYTIIKLFINIVVIVLFFIMLELNFRVFLNYNHKSLFATHAALFWKNSPNIQDEEFEYYNNTYRVNTNADGFRNSHLSPAKSLKSYRIVCLGDEITFGAGVNQIHTYPNILESMMRSSYHFYITEVVNAGVIGYSSYQNKVMLWEYCSKYNPDLIVVMALHNDYVLESRADEERIPQNPILYKIQRNLFDLRTYTIAKSFVSGVFPHLFLEETGDKSVFRVSPNDYKRNLEEIADIADELEAKVIFINPPDKNTAEVKEALHYKKILKEVAQERGVYIDLKTMFYKKRGYYLSNTDVPSPRGHQTIALEVFRKIHINNLVPQRPGGTVMPKPEAPPAAVPPVPEGQISSPPLMEPPPGAPPGMEPPPGIPPGMEPPPGIPPGMTPPPIREHVPIPEPPREPGNQPDSHKFYF